jgi:monoamine oxidase
MIGDQISYHSGWQEGAIASTENAINVFNKLVSQVNPDKGGTAHVA